MKNIHLLPTDKPSNLTVRTKTNELLYSYKLFSSKNGSDINVNQHIYITSDEEIKEGDWIKWGDAIYKANRKYIPPFKKIILTTDQDLIADGVQAINNEFLEWFVNNPSYEIAHVVYDRDIITEGLQTLKYGGYRIIIPKEESKQKTRVFGTEDDKSFWSDKPKQKCEHIKEYGCIKDICTCNTGPKQDPTLENAKLALREYILANKEKVTEDLQEMREKSGTGRDETLEEAAKRTYQKGLQDDIDLSFYDGVRLGAKWQAERMYSETEVLQLLLRLQQVESYNNLYDWFEQFKKKD
jgi:hypothetical protein